MLSVHHFTISTSDLRHRVSQFKKQFGFQIFAHYTSPSSNSSSGVALFINSVVVVVSEVVPMETSHTSTDDWISDVVLHTTDSNQYWQMYERMSTYCQRFNSSESSIYQTSSSQTHSHSNNRSPSEQELNMFQVLTPFKSVQHTVICGQCNCIKSQPFTGKGNINCLIGYKWCSKLFDKSCDVCDSHFTTDCFVNVPTGISHVDHVTFACHTNTSEMILKWYEDCLGFQRFKVNSMDNGEGFIIEGANGMRMLAMQYWQCSEIGAKIGQNKDQSVQLVFAEPLPNSKVNQVQTFLKDNNGPGVQHIAFCTEDIVGVVSCLRSNLVPFITPPPEYYLLFEKLQQIERAKKEVYLLQQNGILIDIEANESDTETDPRYLMQVFSYPVFNRNTFFVEVIQRCGARGFGAGNITALWKALEIHFSQ